MVTFALAFNLMVFLTACVAMMAVFLGGSGYLPVLVVLLVLTIPVSLISAFVPFILFARRVGLRRALPEAWRRVPQWSAVAVWLGIALILCGEFALILALGIGSEPFAPWQHLPVLAGLLATVAWLLVHAWQHRDDASRAR